MRSRKCRGTFDVKRKEGRKCNVVGQIYYRVGSDHQKACCVLSGLDRRAVWYKLEGERERGVEKASFADCLADRGFGLGLWREGVVCGVFCPAAWAVSPAATTVVCCCCVLASTAEGAYIVSRAQVRIGNQGRGGMGVLSNRVLKDDLVPGDHIYSWRSAYTYAHHGIYCGENKVIHFTRGRNEELGTGNQYLDVFLASSRPDSATRSCPDCGMHGESNGVVESCLTCFLAGCPLYRFEYGENTLTFLAKARGGTCTLAETDPAEVVLHRAEYLLNNGFGCYHIFHNNCEDFAIYCKTGLLVVEKNLIGRSGQAASVFGAPFAAVVSSPLRFMMANPWGAAAVSAGVYFFCRYATDIGIRKDVAKVAVEDLAVNLGWSQVAVLGALEAARSGTVPVQGFPGPCLQAIEAAVPTHAQVADVAGAKESLEVGHCKSS